MIDIHSHILPGVDDGPRTLDMALDMLRMAVDSGVKTQVLTPHIQAGRFENTKQGLDEHFQAFNKEVQKANLPIKLLLGAEVRIGPEIMQLVERDAIPWLGEYRNKKTFLLEFPPYEIPHASDNLIKWLLNRGCLPIIVHPERNRTFTKHKEKLQALIELGCPIQVTASSLKGKFGREAQAMAEELLRAGQVTSLASDCHNLTSRSPDLFKGFELASKLIGKEKAAHLVINQPKELTTNNAYNTRKKEFCP